MAKNWVRNLCVPAAMAFSTITGATGSYAHAQAVYGQIQGTVTDATGAAVPNASITVTDEAKGTTVTMTTNASGEFVVSHLIPDTYDVKVGAAGFKGYEQKGLQIFADGTNTVSAILPVGTTNETVTVEADAVPQLKTDRADVATNFNAQELTELPIPDHNFANLQLLLPGAVQLGWAHAASENPQGSKQIQIDGQAFGGVNYTLDGTDNQDAILGIIVINPNSESMSEAKLATQNFDAEFGKAVASVETVQTKSGTNVFHGTLFDNRESNANLARDPFTGYNTSTNQKIPYGTGLKNQFGGSIGGPILRDKIFFFGDYQGVRQKSAGTGIGTVPTLLALQSCTGASNASNGQPGCDFSQYLNATNAEGNHQLYNNASGTPVAYTNNIIPLSQLSPQAVNLFKLLLANGKTPNSTGINGAGLRNNYVGSGTGIFNSNQWDVRGDATLNQRVHIFGRFSRFTDTLSGASLFGAAGGPGLGIAGFGGVSNGANDSLALGTDVVINSKLVTDIRLGYFRYNIITHKNDPGNTNLPFLGENVSGTGSSLAIGTDFGTPDIQIADTNQTNLSSAASTTQNQGPQFGSGLNMNHCNCPLKEKEDQFQIVNNWTKTIGNHSVKFGVDLRYARNLRVPSDSDRTGVNNFGNGPTSNGSVGGLGFASFITGDVTSFNRYTSTSTNAKEFQPRDFFYGQDTWRVTPKLTLNLGTRYEYYAAERVNGAGNGALLNLQTGFINVAGVGGVPLNMGVASAKNTWNPRLGAAYQLDSKTVIRAGYGRSFDLGVFGSEFGHVVTQNIPVLANQSLNAVGGNTSYAFNLSSPGVGGTGTAYPNASSPLSNFTPPAANSSGQIAITASIPGANPATTIGQSVSVKARPFTERLPTLDAWNFAVQRSLTPSLSIEVAYVGNKGSHTLSDGDGNNTNPNEAAIALPASFNVTTNQALHYDPAGGSCLAGTSGCLTANAVGSTGATSNTTLLQRYTNGNLPACGSGACNWTQGISYYGDDQDTHYNALQLKVTKNYTKGLSINGNYAYQVGTDNASGFATWNKQAIIGNDQAIRRNAFTGYGLWHLPFGKNQMLLNQGGVVNYIVGGWEISPVFVYQSGLPFTLSYDSCANQVPGDAPCQVNGNAGSLKTGLTGFGNGAKYFTAPGLGGAFTAPGLDTIGNVGRNTAWGPHFFNSDMSLMKNVTFHERYTAQFRMDAFNAFNHINYGTPAGSVQSGGGIGSGSYPSSLSGTTNPRQLQFTLHLAF
ncbi:Carboxypeptidase regulatory-like domain-containing protein [Bryocella elongata]|uniref:Carboxypeptidase regulatory-like domain-containing protein n=1 Tax=Bryocella elongata TaxID=863522 RepID=A0A1H5U6Q2_9BACT|nr:carboxypeptidase-like regulatory domain-containing protein [Bryocella elongata]SEF70726.1 Carboxypeptidase regulatory-like domain-containing protein [Bryocella elongata]